MSAAFSYLTDFFEIGQRFTLRFRPFFVFQGGYKLVIELKIGTFRISRE